MNRFLVFLLGISLYGCSAEQSENSNDILVVRVPRKILLNNLVKDEINLYQEGQTITFLVPADKLFERNTSQSVIRSNIIYSDLARVLNSYRIENISITAYDRGENARHAGVFNRKRAQIVMSSLVRNGLKAPVLLTNSKLTTNSDSRYGIKLKSYIKIKFRYLKVLV